MRAPATSARSQFDERDAAVLQLQHLLLARRFSTSFGAINYGKFVTDPATFDKWVKDHPGADVSGAAGNRFGFSQTLSKGVASEAIAESAKGVKAWADSPMTAGGSSTGNSQPLPRADRPEDVCLRGRGRIPRPAGRGHQGQRAVAQERHQRALDAAVRTAGVELPSSRPSPQGEREPSLHDRPLIVEEGLSAPRRVSPIFEGRSGRDDGNGHMPDSSFSATALDRRRVSGTPG